MTTDSQGFRRLVLGLRPSAPGSTMRLAVELADMLQLELLGLFLEDPGLRHLAGMPFAREFRPLGGGWRPLDVEELSRELEDAARHAERAFADAAKHLATHCHFEVMRASIAESIASISRAGDIVMIIEPPSAAERATQQFAFLLEAAFRSPAAVLLVPSRIARTTGAIVVIARALDDPGIRAGAAIARAAREALVIVDIGPQPIDDAALRRDLAAMALPDIRHFRAAPDAHGVAPLAPVLRPVQERLVVVTRETIDDATASALTTLRHVPVLVIEATESEAATGARQ
jgi:hypothetical protein